MDLAPTYRVERQQRIDAPPSAVMPYLVDFHRWIEWSPWEGLDADLKRTYEGPESGVGAVYRWRGNRKAGAGRMEILEVDDDRRLVIDLEFLKPFRSRSTTTFTLTPVEPAASAEAGDVEATTVTWTMTGNKGWLARLMGVVVSMDRMVGPDFEKGLARLRAVVEQRAEEA